MSNEEQNGNFAKPMLSAVLPSVSTKGVTRIVVLWRGVVIKFPKPMKWSNFLRGLIGNINERDTYRWNSGKYEKGYSHLLAPVIWCSWGGWILIMKRAKLLTEQEWGEGEWAVKEHIQNFRGDDTISNYGIINKKLVKIDYGELDYYWGEDFKDVAQYGR
ncbi:MAG: hypothetical protein ABIP51_03270 [Bacteroidia bacterium]